MSGPVDLTRAIAAAAEKVAPTRGVYTLAEVAEITGWNADSIRRDCKNDVYEYTKRGKHYGMTLPQVVAMVASHRRAGKATDTSMRTEADEIAAVLEFNASRFRQRGAA